MRSLIHLLAYDVSGEDKQFYHYTAHLIRVIAAERKTDYEKTGSLIDMIEPMYKDPFGQYEKAETGQDIINALLGVEK